MALADPWGWDRTAVKGGQAEGRAEGDMTLGLTELFSGTDVERGSRGMQDPQAKRYCSGGCNGEQGTIVNAKVTEILIDERQEASLS